MSQAADLSVNFAGVRFPNPFVLASGPPTRTGEMIERAFETGWGGAVIKTLASDHRQFDDVRPRMARITSGKEVVGLANIEICSMRSLDMWYRDIQRIKRNYPGHPVISSLLHSNNPTREEWQRVAKWSEEAGCDAIEMNLGCSHGMAEHGGGAAIGRNSSAIAEVVAWVCEVVKIPVIVKLPAAPGFMGSLARSAEIGGASGITAINSVPSMIGVDLDQFSPLPAVDGQGSFTGSFGGYSGLAIKPIGLRCVAEVRKETSLPIMACGGIDNWRGAAEHIVVGGTCVQVCTAAMEHGFRIVKAMKINLARYMHEKGFESIESMSGRALAQLRVHSQLPVKQRNVVSIDADTCIKCGKCYVSCEDTAYQAFDWKKGDVPVLHEEHCDGCNLCVQVCPVDNCITMVRSTVPYVERRGNA